MEGSSVSTIESKEKETPEEGQVSSAGPSITKEYRKFRNRKSFNKELLQRLTTAGLDDYDHFLSSWKEYNPNEIVKKINGTALQSQKHGEMHSKDLHTYHKLAEMLTFSRNPNTSQPNNEIALAVEAIAHLEPSETKPHGAVDIDNIYQNIATLMRGEPILNVDPESISVIHEAINQTMADVEGPQGQEDIKRLRELLMNDTYADFTQNQAMELKALFSDETFNPLKLPFEFFVNKPFD